jgi:UDP-glucose 4-epimerase
LVSGGAGFIGSHLVDVLAECSVRIFDDFSTGREENIVHHRGSPRVEIVRGDVRDPAAVAVALQGIDVVFHLACRGVRHSIGKPAENHDVNATGTLLLLAAARRAGVERFVHVSSSEVYGTARYVPMDENHPTFPETVYGAAKLAGECYARAYHQTYGLATVIVRPFNNFGPRSHHEGDSGEVIPRFTVWALNGKAPIIFGDGNQTRDFMYVAETTYWLCRVAECDRLVGGTINLSSGRETPILALADLVYETVGGKRMVPVFQPSRPGDVRRHQGDVEQARRVIGFEPKITLGEGIRKLVAHFRSRAEGVSALLNDTQPVNWTTVP